MQMIGQAVYFEIQVPKDAIQKSIFLPTPPHFISENQDIITPNASRLYHSLPGSREQWLRRLLSAHTLNPLFHYDSLHTIVLLRIFCTSAFLPDLRPNHTRKDKSTATSAQDGR